jgi:predicted RNA-binding Zn-ribbon protein involved in translation (DUF1610 family)
VTLIKASCPTCGDVDLRPRQVRLVVCSVPERSSYAFSCPRCSAEVRRPADGEVVRLLRAGGVVAERWDIPAEALEERTGPALGYDDLLDFVLWLERADLPAAAAQLASRPASRPTDRQR